MEAIYQIYEKMPEVITIPTELRDRRVEVILQPLDDKPDLAELAARVGMKLEDVKDLHALRFMGSMPDFPPRAPQGEYEEREKFDWE
ncbi:MAG: hypothetical protein AB7P14_09795 [Blastocatellales bacterium]